MHRFSGCFGRRAAFALMLTLAATGCDEDKHVVAADAGLEDAGPTGPILDKELSEAVAAAQAPEAKGSGAADDGPPENGVFAPGAADKAHGATAPTKVEVIDQGTEPRFTLATDVSPGVAQTISLVVAVRMGAQAAMPTIQVELALQIPKAKAAKGATKDEAPAEEVGPIKVIAKVAAVTLGPQAQQPGAVPKELQDELSKLKGSEIRYITSPNGAGSAYELDLAKGADPNLQSLMSAVVESLSAFTVPLPDKPIGKGGYWMATDRSSSLGMGVVRYRVFRVEQIEAESATLTIETRQYATEAKANLPGAPPGELVVAAFESQGKGKLSLEGKQLVPARAQMTQRTGARLQMGEGQTARQMPLQAEVTSELSSEKPKK